MQNSCLSVFLAQKMSKKNPAEAGFYGNDND